MQFAGRPVEHDTSAGSWIAEALDGHPWSTVASLLPPVFQAYARVLHPAWRYDGDDDIAVAWSEVAAYNGTIAHPLMQWVSVTGGWEYWEQDSQPPFWDRAPDEGHLPTTVADPLARVLRRHTSTPEDCWFGVWHGFGTITAVAPTLVLPNREHWLVRGPVELAAANMADEPGEQSGSLWWPADRAWFVATDVDLMSTYVGGSAACVADLLATPLEVVRAGSQDGVGFDTDTVNPLPPRD